MFNYDKSGLLIFDNFQIDFNLPKWKERMKKNDPTTPTPFMFPRMNRRNGELIQSNMGLIPVMPMSPDGSFVVAGMSANGISGGVVGVQDTKKPSLFDRIFRRKRLKKLQQELADAISKPNFTVETLDDSTKFDIEDFFKSVKNSAEELEIVEERLKNWETAYEHLKKTGQYALIEVMQQDIEVHRAETQLYAIGLKKVITEKNVTELSAKYPKTIKLDWIQNFTRLIPAKVTDIKMNADEKHIFDNYVVMHCDKDGKGSQETVAEKIKRKDPILFGVIAGSNKLYYVADWVDEFCDLTFDKLVETLGENAINANDLTVNIQISE